MVTRTQYKLHEAQFFMAHIERDWRHLPQVDFYLSAFVSAARSVTWVMRAEFSNVMGWSQWFDAKKPSSTIRGLLKTMNDVRVRATKTDPLKTRTTAKISISPDEMTPEIMAYLEGGATGLIYLEPVDSTNTTFVIKKGNDILAKAHLTCAQHELPEFQGQDSKDVCREYLRELEDLVKECHAKFNPPSKSKTHL
jgi:hypothetical protein